MNFRIFTLVAIILNVSSIWAHNVRIFAAYEGNDLTGRAYSGATGLPGVTIKITNLDGKDLASVKTDDDGNFSLRMEKRVPVKLHMQLADGHSAKYLLKWDVSTVRDDVASVAATVDSKQVESVAVAVDPELARLRSQVMELNGKRRFRDVMGGIGFIFGIAGIFMMAKVRRAKNGQ